MRDDVRQLAEVTDSGWTNGYITKKWLEQVFDPCTRERVPSGQRRLLIMDGHDTHVKVDFLHACWARDISCLILPANMSSILQPLDVAFFNQLKMSYHSKCKQHLLHTRSTTLAKGLFWQWHQEAWNETAVGRKIRPGWRDSGLWPLDRSMMGAEVKTPHTPPPNPVPIEPPTPRTIRIGRSNDRAVRRGELDMQEVLRKTQKALEGSQAEVALLQAKLEGRNQAEELDRAARSKTGKSTFPHGGFLDPIYQAEHAEELAARESREKDRTAAKKQKLGAVSVPERSNFVLGQAGLSANIVQSLS